MKLTIAADEGLQVLFYGTLGYGRDQKGVLSDLLNAHSLCLEHLMSALTEFYTGSYSSSGSPVGLKSCSDRDRTHWLSFTIL